MPLVMKGVGTTHIFTSWMLGLLLCLRQNLPCLHFFQLSEAVANIRLWNMVANHNHNGQRKS